MGQLSRWAVERSRKVKNGSRFFCNFDSTLCDANGLPDHIMATNETTGAPAEGQLGGSDSAPAPNSSSKNNGHFDGRNKSRGNRGGRDRGNDKQKRKHSGFGSAKYVVARLIPKQLHHFRPPMPTLIQFMIEGKSPISASKSATIAMRSDARSLRRTIRGTAS